MHVLVALDGIALAARRGDTLLDAALDAGRELPHECGGNCACTTCCVTIEAGMENLSPVEAAEAERLKDVPDGSSALRLACQAILRGGDVIARRAR